MLDAVSLMISFLPKKCFKTFENAFSGIRSEAQAQLEI